MTQEEKYKEALLEARAVLEPCLKYSKGKVREALDSIDKELKSFESEDERIMKTIRQLLETARDAHSNTSLAQPYIDALAWLEKQKEQKPMEWKPQPESLEALLYAIEGEWGKIEPTSYLSRRLEDLYEGLVNTFHVDESLFAELPKTAYTTKDIEELKVLKDKIEASMESPVNKPIEWSKVTINGDPISTKNKSVNIPLTEWSEEDKSFYDSIICEVVNEGINLTPAQANWLKSLPERFSYQTK